MVVRKLFQVLLRVCCRLCDKMLLKSMLSDVALACNMWFKKTSDIDGKNVQVVSSK